MNFSGAREFMSAFFKGPATLSIVPADPRIDDRRQPSDFLTASDMREIAHRFLDEGQNGAASEYTRRKLQAIDRSCRFSPRALLLFQDLLARLGVATTRPIALPVNDVPFWHRTANPFA